MIILFSQVPGLLNSSLLLNIMILVSWSSPLCKLFAEHARAMIRNMLSKGTLQFHVFGTIVSTCSQTYDTLTKHTLNKDSNQSNGRSLQFLMHAWGQFGKLQFGSLQYGSLQFRGLQTHTMDSGCPPSHTILKPED